MGFYSQSLFPLLCDFALNRPFIGEERRQLLATATGDVIEIGFGTGLNLPHYPTAVKKVTAVDPNEGMNRLARRRANESRIDIDHRTLSGEQLPFEDNAFDTAVSTFTLCSIKDVTKALAELFRVLRPGGQFLFLEHGLSPDPGVQKWQQRLNWLQERFADGCRLDRNIKALIAAQPFCSIQSAEFYLQQAPKTHGYIYRGMAVK